MDVTKDRLERVWKVLSGYNADFLFAYDIKSQADPELEFKWAWSRTFKTQEEYQKIAPRYVKFATLCCRNNRNFVLEKELDSCPESTHSASTDHKEDATVHSNWYLFVGAGPIRKKGYVLVTRIAAINESIARQYVRKIQQAFVNAGILIWPATLFRAFRRLALKGGKGDRQEWS